TWARSFWARSCSYVWPSTRRWSRTMKAMFSATAIRDGSDSSRPSRRDGQSSGPNLPKPPQLVVRADGTEGHRQLGQALVLFAKQRHGRSPARDDVYEVERAPPSAEALQ